MDRKRDRLAKAQIYVVLDRQVADYSRLFVVLKEAVTAGADIIQLRDKVGSARDILDFSRRAVKYLKRRAIFIMNDRVDLAILSGADGVHVGQEDILIGEARRMMGPRAVIGVSCQNLAHARQAQRQGADYIGWGSVFKTLTKPDRHPMNIARLAKDVAKIDIPVFVIGGINLTNVGRLTEAGLKKIAVTRAVCLARNVGKTVRDFSKTLETVNHV